MYKRISPDLKEDMMLVNIVIAGKATWKELNNDCDIDEVLKINALVDIETELNAIG
jgi:hypothetical protein